MQGVSDRADRARPRVLVLGGGFAGIGAAQKLHKSDVDVVVVDKNNYHTFQPLLYQVATGLLEQPAVGHPIRDLFHGQENARLHKDRVTAIDLDKREVQFAELGSVGYDYLVFGLGAEVNFFGVEGAAEHAFPLYTLSDAVRLKNHILGKWEAADKDPALLEDGSLNIVVVGGGPTGVETAGALVELYTGAFRKDYPDIGEDAARITLVEAGPEIFSMFKPELRNYAVEALTKRGVEVTTGEVVESITPQRVKLKSGKELKAHTLVWGAGLQGNALVQSLGLDLERGNRIAVDAELRLPQSPRGVRRRRCRGNHRLENAAGPAAARLRGAPVGRARRRDDRPACRKQGVEAVQVPRQGHDGDDRPRRSRRADARRQDDEGQVGAARLGNGSPRPAPDERRPREGRGRLVRRGVHAPALGQDLRRDVTNAGVELFERLGAVEDLPLLKRVTGTMLFELTGGTRTERWRVTVNKGAVAVARGNGPADCVMRADRKLFGRMASGKMNAFAAVLRGAVTIEGDPRLLVLFQRLLPGPRS